MNSPYPILLIVILFIVGCDPSRRIEMKNRSTDTTEIVWKVKEDSIGFNPFNISNNQELKFVLPPHARSDIKMSFGVGTWSPGEVEKVIKGLEYLEINSPRYKMKIDSLPLLREYLLARRNGWGGSRIQIVIKK